MNKLGKILSKENWRVGIKREQRIMTVEQLETIFGEENCQLQD